MAVNLIQFSVYLFGRKDAVLEFVADIRDIFFSQQVLGLADFERDFKRG